MPNPAWSRAENEATVASYFMMLEARLRGGTVNQAEQNRQLRNVLNGRTHAAVEFKHQNISAILIDLGIPYISGYKPAKNYQQDLRVVIIEQLTERRILREVIAKSALEVPAAPSQIDPAEAFTTAPPPRPPKDSSKKRSRTARPPVDYLRLEAQNAALGLAGEHFIMDLERERLERAGKGQLAAQVVHISLEKGDGFGFDILSFEEDSREMLIEVKTTKYGEYTPFYVSRNEVEVSEESAESYYLYRVHSFGSKARVFTRMGSLARSFDLTPASFIARAG